MNKYKEKVLNELTNRILRHPFPEESVDQLVNTFIKVYNLPDELIINNGFPEETIDQLVNNGDHIPRID